MSSCDYRKVENLSAKENIEIQFWKDNEFESSKNFTKENFLNKTRELQHFNYKVEKYWNLISGSKKILEIGAGQGWASCYLKKYFLPNSAFTVSDISKYAIQSLEYWEAVFDVQITHKVAALSYDVPMPDATYDLIFCYAAAHHFVRHSETLDELSRLLSDDGIIIFLYEPVTPKYFYKLFYKYVNSMPHSTPEDVLVPSQFLKLALDKQLSFRVIYDAHQSINRGLLVSSYFGILKIFPFLQPYFPASADLIFKKIEK